MKQIMATLILALVAASTWAADAPAKNEKAAAKPARTENLLGKYTGLVKQLNLTEEQQTQLKAIVADEKKATEAFEGDKGKKLAELEAQAKPLAEQIKALQDERRKINADTEAKVAALLTADQKANQGTPQLMNKVLGAFRYTKTIELSADQKTKIEALCKETAGKLAGTTDKKQTDEITAKLMQDAEAVLTDAQKAELAAARPQPKAKPEPKAEKPAKK
jgi:Spy/CpxP family protein refolding chaperone